MPGSRVPGPLGLALPEEDQDQQPRSHYRSTAFRVPGPTVDLKASHAASRPADLSPQERAKKLVSDFASRKGSKVFTKLDRQSVADGLLVRIDNPGKIDQGKSSLCGPADLVYDLASTDPVEYAQFVIDLFETGTATIGKLTIKPGSDLKAAAPAKSDIDPSDWIPLASIRDSENWFFDYEDVKDEAAGITLPGELAGWFEKVGYTQIKNETNLVLCKTEKNARLANEFFGQGFRVCLFINDNMMYCSKQDSASWFPSHWVVLVSPLVIDNFGVHFEVFTWGEGKKRVPVLGQGKNDPPQGKPLSLAHFLKNYYGFVAVKH
jgi:hypothetical protein